MVGLELGHVAVVATFVALLALKAAAAYHRGTLPTPARVRADIERRRQVDVDVQ